MKFTKIIVAGAIAAGTVASGAGLAGAEHGHYVIREDRNGETHCRYVAGGQTSKGPDDPGGHKFHDNVHNGQPGTDERGNDFDKESNEAERCDHVNDNGRRGRE